MALAQRQLEELKSELDKMERAGIPSKFQRDEYNRVKAQLDALRAVYG